MMLNDRLSRLERKVDEQNEAIKKVALYAIEILEENDRLWKHIMNDIAEKKKESYGQKIAEPTLRFRSKTPPPLSEPKSPQREQTLKVRKVIEGLNSDMILSMLKMEMEQAKNCTKACNRRYPEKLYL